MDNMKSKLIFVLFFGFTIASQSQNMIKLSEENSFGKKQITSNSEKFTFAILGDKTTGGVANWPIFDKAVDEINLLQPDFVIMVGDMIQGTVTDTLILNRMWKEFRLHSDRLNVPLYVFPGNHDISNEVMYDYWNKKIGLRYYSFVYNNSLFILLNSEEFHKTKDGELGRKQLDFVKEQLEKNSDVDQTFIFLHRPIWYKNASKNGYEEWKNILSWSKNRKTTAFAGHRHHLTFDKIEGKRHIILSATGGDLEEKPLSELGYFQHYSLVTVDKDTSFISIIKPGNIFQENIATEEYVEKFANIIKWKTDVNIVEDEVLISFNIIINNALNKNMEFSLNANDHNNSDWEFDKTSIKGIAKINEIINYEFTSKNKIENSIPFPSIEYTLNLDGKMVESKSITIAPADYDDWSYPERVLVFGGLDLGISKDPRNYHNVAETQIASEVGWKLDQQLISSKIEDGLVWHGAEVKNGTIKLDQYFEKNNFAFGFIKFIVTSTKDINILTSIVPDNYGQVYLNGKLVFEGSPFSHVPSNPYLFLLKLQKGNNEVLIKTADYYGSWYVSLKMLDTNKVLKYKLPNY